jgi:hypothetical protein
MQEVDSSIATKLDEHVMVNQIIELSRSLYRRCLSGHEMIQLLQRAESTTSIFLTIVFLVRVGRLLVIDKNGIVCNGTVVP